VAGEIAFCRRLSDNPGLQPTSPLRSNPHDVNDHPCLPVMVRRPDAAAGSARRGGVWRWDWGTNNGYADTSEMLRAAFAKNPYLKLFVACGYYDMATPYFAAEYTLNHMNLEAGQRGNIRLEYYEAGHMMYIDARMLAKLKQDVAAFIKGALARTGKET
jgi:carboxypeptidase C (cathepsin A)